MALTNLQFEALAKLRGQRKASRTYAAMRDVLVHESTPRKACEKHGIDRVTLNKGLWSFRKSLALVYTVVCNDEYKAPDMRTTTDGTPQC